MTLSHHHRWPESASVTRHEDGYILAMMGLLIVPLLLMVGLSVDVGMWYNRASDVQKAADAAALAGVVWLPEIDVAQDEARAVAARNGFDFEERGDDGELLYEVTAEEAAARRLRVTVTDRKVESFFWANLGGRSIEVTRQATAQYVLPVPMGSPRNFFGTGQLNTGYPAEQLFLSVNPWCTTKDNGDRYQSGVVYPFYQPGTTNHNASEDCPGATPNAEYRDTGYEMYIEAPTGRASPIEIRLWDPRYNSGSEVRWGSGNSGRVTEAAIDSRYVNDEERYTFTLYEADDTPLTDEDNTEICSQTFGRDDWFDNLNYLGSRRWVRLKEATGSSSQCIIGTNDPDGRYILRVTNEGRRNSPPADGSNQWGLVAYYTNGSGNRLCDGRVDSMCPRVYGKESISVRAAADADVASFYFSEIGPEHEGKLLQLELFDPGEGGNFIEFMEPTGPNSWAPVRFDWYSEGVGSGTNVERLELRDGSVDRFDGRLLEIQIRLDDYDPPDNNNWWQVRYTFRANVDVTDRTTWSARIIGDPVHLIEE